MTIRFEHAVAAAVLILHLAAAEQASAQDADTAMDSGTFDKATADRAFPAERPYSPWAGRNFPSRPLFGDTHLHTSFSMDAGAFGARLGPREAYRFAKGEEVMASSGQPVKLSRPLDFLVVADHSDNMGFFPQLLAGDHDDRVAGPHLELAAGDSHQSTSGARETIRVKPFPRSSRATGPKMREPTGSFSLVMSTALLVSKRM